MASKTTNYGLNKHSPQDFYNVEARNENWDKIDEALAATDPTKIAAKAEPADGDGVMIADSAAGGKAKRLLWSSVKTALGKLFVPLARKINGKALSSDVTLTGDDIAMGADDAESLRAAMAKRAVGSAILPDNTDLDTVTVSGMYRLAVMEPPWQSYSQMLVVHGGADTISQVIFAFWGGGVYVRTGNPSQIGGPGAWRDWTQLATCTAPEVHNLPLTSGFTGELTYFKTQENICTVSGTVYGTYSAGQYIIVGTLPEGFKPVRKIEFALTSSNGAAGSGYVSTSGNIRVQLNSTATAYLYFSISFPCS